MHVVSDCECIKTVENYVEKADLYLKYMPKKQHKHIQREIFVWRIFIERKEPFHIIRKDNKPTPT